MYPNNAQQSAGLYNVIILAINDKRKIILVLAHRRYCHLWISVVYLDALVDVAEAVQQLNTFNPDKPFIRIKDLREQNLA